MPRQLYPYKLFSSAQACAGTSGLVYSPAIQLRDSIGNMGILVTLAAASGTPHVDILLQASDDDPNGPWYSPQDTGGNSLCTIHADLQTTRWVQFSPPLAKYIRIVFDGTTGNSAATTVNGTVINQVEL